MPLLRVSEFSNGYRIRRVGGMVVNVMMITFTADSDNPFVPHAVILYKDYDYWSDWNTGEIERANKMTGYNRTIVHTNMKYTNSLLVFHPFRQSRSNQCRTNNVVRICALLP